MHRLQKDAYSRDVKSALAIAAGIFFTDQLTKYFLFQDLFFGPIWFSRIVRFTNHFNTGVVFDLPVPRWFILSISTIILLLLCWTFIVMVKNKDHIRTMVLAIIIGGAIGNYSDRLFFGFVRDWILIADRSVFNLSDFAILFGVIQLFFLKNFSAK